MSAAGSSPSWIPGFDSLSASPLSLPSPRLGYGRPSAFQCFRKADGWCDTSDNLSNPRIACRRAVHAGFCVSPLARHTPSNKEHSQFHNWANTNSPSFERAPSGAIETHASPFVPAIATASAKADPRSRKVSGWAPQMKTARRRPGRGLHSAYSTLLRISCQILSSKVSRTFCFRRCSFLNTKRSRRNDSRTHQDKGSARSSSLSPAIAVSPVPNSDSNFPRPSNFD